MLLLCFPVHSFKDRIVTGFYRAGTHRLEWVRHCPVNAGPLDALYRTLLDGLADLPFGGYDERTHEGKLRHLVMRAGIRTQETLLSFVINGKLSAKGVSALVALGAKGHPTTLTLNHNSRPGNVILVSYTEPLLGDGLIREKLGDWTLSFGTTSFFQVNTAQAEQLFSYASAQAGEGGRVLELYSGVGSLTCWLAAHNEVTSVEDWRYSVEMAENNLRLNGLAARTLCGKAEDVIEELHGTYDTVVMDPPRNGCDHRVLAALHRFNTPRIVYVSCNPATLARDCKILAGYGYRLISIRSFDMFPQTAHVETVCLLSKLNTKQHIEISLDMDELDLTDAEKKATYQEIKDYVLEHSGLKVSSLYIAQVKQKCGIIERENYNKPKSEVAKQPQCPPDKEKGIEALRNDLRRADMTHLISCEFNMYTACVELKFTDGNMIAIDTIAVENEVADNMYQRSELDYLIYNDPLAYADLILNGDPETYLKTVTEYKPLD